MDETVVLESIVVEGMKVNLVYLSEDGYHGLEVFFSENDDEGECQTYDSEIDAWQDFLFLKNGERSVNEVFGYNE